MVAAGGEAPRGGGRGLALRGRAGRGAAVAAGLLALAGGAAGLALLSGGGDGGASEARAQPTVATGTAVARTRRLVDREDVEGRLGFAGRRTVSAAAAGTLTAIRREGATVRRGGSLFAVDGRATAYVLYGRVPAWRALSSGAANGADVEQLERNLVALGHDPYGAITVDEDFDAATAAAVRRWEEARGMTEDGVVEQGEVVFSRGPVRVGERHAAAGDRVVGGRPVLDVSRRRRVVTARLPAGRQALVRVGQRVAVTLPDGTALTGRVREVGRVARSAEEGAEATVSLVVAVGGRVRLDGAPVTVSVASSEARRALAVPVAALLAVGPGRYAVEVRGRGLVEVETGAFADGWVAVRGIREGTRVAVPR